MRSQLQVRDPKPVGNLGHMDIHAVQKRNPITPAPRANRRARLVDLVPSHTRCANVIDDYAFALALTFAFAFALAFPFV